MTDRANMPLSEILASNNPLDRLWLYDHGGIAYKTVDPSNAALLSAMARDITTLQAINADLLAALEALCADIEHHNLERNDTQCPYDFGEGFDGNYDQARAVIARAKMED